MKFSCGRTRVSGGPHGKQQQDGPTASAYQRRVCDTFVDAELDSLDNIAFELLFVHWGDERRPRSWAFVDLVSSGQLAFFGRFAPASQLRASSFLVWSLNAFFASVAILRFVPAAMRATNVVENCGRRLQQWIALGLTAREHTAADPNLGLAQRSTFPDQILASSGGGARLRSGAPSGGSCTMAAMTDAAGMEAAHRLQASGSWRTASKHNEDHKQPTENLSTRPRNVETQRGNTRGALKLLPVLVLVLDSSFGRKLAGGHETSQKTAH